MKRETKPAIKYANPGLTLRGQQSRFPCVYIYVYRYPFTRLNQTKLFFSTDFFRVSPSGPDRGAGVRKLVLYTAAFGAILTQYAMIFYRRGNRMRRLTCSRRAYCRWPSVRSIPVSACSVWTVGDVTCSSGRASYLVVLAAAT